MAGNRTPRAVLRLSGYDWRGMGLEMVQPRRRLWQSATGQAVVGPCPLRAVEGPSRSVVATVFSYVLHGYVSVQARMTSTGAGKRPNSPVGVDISNTHLDVYVGPAGQAARFPNDAAGFTALIAWVAVPVRAVTDEPTGRWHRAFEEVLLKAGFPLVRVNPVHARRAPAARLCARRPPVTARGPAPVLAVP